MHFEEFRTHAHEMVDWIADYFSKIEEYPVKSQVKPGEILATLPSSPPLEPESFPDIFSDFESKILPGVTHWQHPSFHAYFPGNSSPESVLGEMLTAGLGLQCMSWQTSPSGTELEERMMEWLRQMLGLPSNFTGVIQDTASSATLCAILSARERASRFAGNREGLKVLPSYTVYCSSEAHSSIEKAVKIAGLGQENLRKIAVDEKFAMKPAALEDAIKGDLAAGKTPLCVISNIGTTSSTAIDPVHAIGEIAKKYNLFHHVDAAYAGTALILPEMRWMSDGIELADSFVVNPHKWMFTNFDCSAYFVKDPGLLVQTFEILPEYLKTKEGDAVKNFRDWGIALGRRFRSLKLWFVIRSYGVKGIQEKLREHLQIAQWLRKEIEESKDFELLAPVPLNLVCFRYRREEMGLDETNLMNEKLLHALNDTGKLYLTHTKLNGAYAIRLVMGQTHVEKRHIEQAWELIRELAGNL